MAGDPSITFAEFIISLGANAVAMLGQDDDEDLVPSRADLAQAAQHIDMLRLLKVKTAGNLEDEESRLLETLIYDLQCRYLEVAQSQGSPPSDCG